MSSYCELNGLPVIAAHLTLPRVGAWTAALRVDTDKAQGPKASISFNGRKLVLEGTVLMGGVESDVAEVQVVGGKANLGKRLPAKFYRAAPVRLPLQDLLREAGEALSPASDGRLLARNLTTYSRLAGPAGHSLRVLLDSLRQGEEAPPTWRVEPDGTVRVGYDSFPKVSPSYELLRRAPMVDRAEVYQDEPSLLPGTTFLDRRISCVEMEVSDERLRTTLWWERA